MTSLNEWKLNEIVCWKNEMLTRWRGRNPKGPAREKASIGSDDMVYSGFGKNYESCKDEEELVDEDKQIAYFLLVVDEYER